MKRNYERLRDVLRKTKAEELSNFRVWPRNKSLLLIPKNKATKVLTPDQRVWLARQLTEEESRVLSHIRSRGYLESEDVAATRLEMSPSTVKKAVERMGELGYSPLRLDNIFDLTGKQWKVLNYVKENGLGASKNDIAKELGITTITLNNALRKMGIVESAPNKENPAKGSIKRGPLKRGPYVHKQKYYDPLRPPKKDAQNMRKRALRREPIPLDMQVEFWVTEGYSNKEIMEEIGKHYDFTKPKVTGNVFKGAKRETVKMRSKPKVVTPYESIWDLIEATRLKVMDERGIINPSLTDAEKDLKRRHPAFKEKPLK
jgi:DNA-binding MarR family transcriptional regulator